MKAIVIVYILLFSLENFSQVTLDANGPGNTYEEITAVLAPGYDPVEEPDCNHSSFGRHIDEIFDADLNTNVFRFFMHVTPDNDRCINTDRQRNEIKSYDKSPDNLLGVEDEEVVYKWKFKLDENLQVSSSFTHVHQLKSVGGNLESMPMYTLTLRKSTPDRLELRYAETDTQITLKQTDLAPLIGVWLEVEETITYGTSGAYSIEIKKVSDDSVLFDYTNNSIINWRTGADFVRPKWGIYRSLNSSQDLRDEEVLFANFSVQELSSLSLANENREVSAINVYPNPANSILKIEEFSHNTYDAVKIINHLGQDVINYRERKGSIDISKLTKGIYTIIFSKNNAKIVSKKFIVH
jgi:hypothetical protein